MMTNVVQNYLMIWKSVGGIFFCNIVTVAYYSVSNILLPKILQVSKLIISLRKTHEINMTGDNRRHILLATQLSWLARSHKSSHNIAIIIMMTIQCKPGIGMHRRLGSML